MPVPASITDLSTTAASNFPAGSDSPSSLDDTQRAHASFIATIRDTVGLGTGTLVPATARTNFGAAASGANTDITSLNAPALGAATATTQATGTSNTTVATTAFVQGAGNPAGTVIHVIMSTAPTGYLKANGFTIGNASSGGTARANADTQTLFELLWNNITNANLPIQDSAGSASTRGASATADFTANKRMPLPDLRGEFMRGFDDGKGTDSGRAIGSTQLDQSQDHTHGFSVYLGASGANSRMALGTNGTNTLASSDVGAPQANTGGTPRTGTETRPRNLALLACIKY